MPTQMTDWRAHGIRVTHAVAEFGEPALRRGGSDDDMVRLHFGLRGDYRVRFPQLDRSYDLIGGHHNIFYSKRFDLEFVNKTPTLETFGVQYPKDQFISYVDGTNDMLSRFCEQVANDDKVILSDQWAPMTPTLEHTIQQIIDCRYEGRLKDLFLLSKSIDLLVQSVETSSASPATRYVKTAADRDKLVAARDCVNLRLTDPPSLTELAKLVGLNEYKLKHGFKEMFGRTVFSYLTDRRLDLAQQMLLDTDKTASEVAFELGYATPQHFSHAFKKRFAVTPNSMRKNPASATIGAPAAEARDLSSGNISLERENAMSTNLTAKTQITVHASATKVWAALTKPELVKKYLFGADVHSDWKVGSALTYTGEYKGEPFEEKGVIKKIEPNKLLQATHFSTTSGKEDKPENYALVTWELAEKNGATLVTVSQDNLHDEKSVEGSKANWTGVLNGLKETAEA